RRTRSVVERLHWLRSHNVKGIPRILSWGLFDDFVRIQIERKPGLTLHDLLITKRLEKIEVQRSLYQMLTHWELIGFVHGDLSPRNILIETNVRPHRVWAIDCLL